MLAAPSRTLLHQYVALYPNLKSSALHSIRSSNVISRGQRSRLVKDVPLGGLSGRLYSTEAPLPHQGGEKHFRDQASEKSDSAAAMKSEETKGGSEDWVMMHPAYDYEEVKQVKVVYHPTPLPKDRIAKGLVKLLRKGFDLVTGYKHSSPEEALALARKEGKKDLSLEQMRKLGLVMDEKQWMYRFLFLESIAGVPGMVAGMLRHLRSLRTMKRDGGWIHMLLEEAENERMHLLTFLHIYKPGVFFRLLVLGAQGVFFNAFFLAYILSPRAAHRFVGALEEEAVLTYTNAIHEIQEGRLPQWTKLDAPRIAKDYWRLRPDSKMVDLIYAIRADESTHRFVNHSLANLDASKDFNPFAMATPDIATKGSRAGFTREESFEWAEKVQRDLLKLSPDLPKEMHNMRPTEPPPIKYSSKGNVKDDLGASSRA